MWQTKGCPSALVLAMVRTPPLPRILSQASRTPACSKGTSPAALGGMVEAFPQIA